MFRKVKDWLLQNQTTPQTIAKNTFWLFFGQMVGRLIRAAIVIYAARLLGAGSWGAFSYALGVAAFLTIFSDIGVNALITKEAAREPELKIKYLATALVIKLVLLAFFAAAVALAFPYLTSIPEAAGLMPILILVFAFDTLRDLGSALSRALERMEIEAGVGIFTNLAIAILGFVLLTSYGTSTALAYAYAMGSGLGLIAAFVMLRRHFRNLIRSFTRSLVGPILKTAWPFGLLGIMGAINLNTDIIMLGWLRSAPEVGYYSAAQKLIQLLYVPPALLATSIFPVLSRLVRLSPDRAKAILEKSMALAIGTAFLLALGGVILAAPIISILFGSEYQAAIPTFQILLLTLLIVYPGVLLGNAIFAYDQERHFAVFVLVAVLGNVFFNFLLIPIWGIEGAAASTVIAQLITNWLIWRKMKSVNQFSIWSYRRRSFPHQ